MMHEKSFKCSYCESQFSREDQLDYHIEAKHPGSANLKFFCSECGDGFMFESNMVKHSLKHKKGDENKSRKQPLNLDSNIIHSLKSDFAGTNVNLENLSDELEKE